MSLHRKKYQNAVLYLCQKLKGEIRGKKKLAKLLYFADFDLYEKSQKSITGDVYRALPMGPVPSTLEEITAEMTKKKMLDRVAVKYGHLNGKQLEELSHAEAPYIGTELRKEIPYELAFYRGTDFSDS